MGEATVITGEQYKPKSILEKCFSLSYFKAKGRGISNEMTRPKTLRPRT